MNKSKILSVTVMLSISALFFSGCASMNNPTEIKPKLQNVQSFNVDGKEFTGVQLLKKNGKIFAGYFRATNGLVVCPHFDITQMNRAHIPVAMSGRWANATLEQSFNDKIISVNDLAKKRGVKIGMSIKKALLLLDK